MPLMAAQTARRDMEPCRYVPIPTCMFEQRLVDRRPLRTPADETGTAHIVVTSPFRLARLARARRVPNHGGALRGPCLRVLVLDYGLPFMMRTRQPTAWKKIDDDRCDRCDRCDLGVMRFCVTEFDRRNIVAASSQRDQPALRRPCIDPATISRRPSSAAPAQTPWGLQRSQRSQRSFPDSFVTGVGLLPSSLRAGYRPTTQE